MYEFTDPAARDVIGHVLDTHPEGQSLLTEAGHRRSLTSQSMKMAAEAFARVKAARLGYEALRRRVDPRYRADRAFRCGRGPAGRCRSRVDGAGRHRVQRGPVRVGSCRCRRRRHRGLDWVRLAGRARRAGGTVRKGDRDRRRSRRRWPAARRPARGGITSLPGARAGTGPRSPPC